MNEAIRPYRSTDRDPRDIPAPQIIPGSEFDIFNDPPLQPDSRVTTVTSLMDSTEGQIANGLDEVDLRANPHEHRSNPVPKPERIPPEVLRLQESLRQLRAAVDSIDDSELAGARKHIIDKDPAVVLFKAISEAAALRNTATTNWQPRLAKLATGHINELAEAADLARRHLLDYGRVAGAVIQLANFVRQYAEVHFPAQAQVQRDQAASDRQEKARHFKSRGLAGI